MQCSLTAHTTPSLLEQAMVTEYQYKGFMIIGVHGQNITMLAIMILTARSITHSIINCAPRGTGQHVFIGGLTY